MRTRIVFGWMGRSPRSAVIEIPNQRADENRDCDEEKTRVIEFNDSCRGRRTHQVVLLRLGNLLQDCRCKGAQLPVPLTFEKVTTRREYIHATC